MWLIAPFGVHDTRNLAVFWRLYHVEDCMCKSEGVRLNISLPSIMAYVEKEASGEGDVA